MPQSPTAPESLGLSDSQINEFLGDFCGTPLTPEQWERFEEKSDFGVDARFTSLSNEGFRELVYTESLEAMAVVRANMSDTQKARFSKLLVRAVLPVAFHARLILCVPEVFTLIDASASLQARIAYEVLNSDTSNEGKLDLARTDLDHIETRETLGLPPARRL